MLLFSEYGSHTLETIILTYFLFIVNELEEINMSLDLYEIFEVYTI